MSNAHAVHPIGSFDTDIVIDLGCCSYQRGNLLEDSITTLIKRFKPKVLFGFDPHPALMDGIGTMYGTTVVTARRAAWTINGRCNIIINGNCTHVGSQAWIDDSSSKAECFDIASWFQTIPSLKTVLKVDVEGAEYVLLPHLIDMGLIDRFSRILVEWHTGQFANGFESDKASILEGINCPVEDWQ